ncbi:Fe(2+) transporter FeoB [Sporomusa silvacetica DSM 10669]|uniref:Ferrous iron transport protein B n=1 Tax=Sporomusa silvacetica DSM 10669 TaxID=1123289 RepID=A0ABZ3IKV2_9FIRM|nr:ferrous iron transport protein B [Sporomusa silvacetica]OZC17310.1 ferrous iron transport protein B [Sporomusa silvacetica DSM 10669]
MSISEAAEDIAVRNKVVKVVLVGSPNVGKSAIFNYLTGSYVAVSNYPGTTVDISTGHFKYGLQRFEIIDTPGMYSLIPLTEEERVTRLLLTRQLSDVVVHVVDAKNLRRMLNMTIQLIDAGLPVILNLNIMDEAQNMGMLINIQLLEKMLGIPVIATSAVNKAGLEALRKAISQYKQLQPSIFKLNDELEQAITKISALLTCSYGMSKRITALLLLQGDPMVLNSVAQTEKAWLEIVAVIDCLALKNKNNLDALVAIEQQAIIDKIVDPVVRCASFERQPLKNMADWLGKITRQPLTGIPILCLVLYFGLYQFVGKFGAGYLVDYINDSVFVPIINPIVVMGANDYIPWEWLRSLLAGEYGIFTMGFRYATAIILPIVGTFFLVFALLEDTGYLPRLAMLVDSVFRYFGLNGRAVIPLTLGLGCGTMAVVVTRTLESKRERLLATFLLSLTIPCSAQLGVVLALLSHNTTIVTIWSAYMLLVFASVGWLSAQFIPGSRSAFYMEIPPLRLPLAGNVLKKAYARMAWYFMEILPVFIITSILLWAGDCSGILARMIRYVEPFMVFIGLPPAAAQAFLLGFFRRDYGAAGLYDLAVAGKLTDAQLLTAAVALTLFVPCVAQLAVMVKERGLVISLAMVVVIIMIAFGSAALIHNVLNLLAL